MAKQNKECECKKQTPLKWFYDATAFWTRHRLTKQQWDEIVKNKKKFEKLLCTPMTEEEAIEFYNKFYGKAKKSN